MPWIYRTPAALLLLLLFAGTASAMWMRVSEQELYDASDVVSVGTLVERVTLRPDPAGPALEVGILQLQEVFKAPDSQPGYVLLRLQPQGQPARSDAIHYPVGAEGLWFLQAVGTDSGLFHADHPQRFLSSEGMDALLQRLRAGEF